MEVQVSWCLKGSMLQNKILLKLVKTTTAAKLVVFEVVAKDFHEVVLNHMGWSAISIILRAA